LAGKPHTNYYGGILPRLKRRIYLSPNIPPPIYRSERIPVFWHSFDACVSVLKPSSGNGQPIITLNSWAAIAAQGARIAGTVEALRPTRYTIRVQLANTEGQNNESIFKEVKKTILSAAGVQVLRSGDIDVIVLDKAAKDRA